jgi:hypothetical protein
MSDITKCKGEGCPMKETCHRFTDPATEYQSYFTESPIIDGKCSMYWGQTQQDIMDVLQDMINGSAYK